MMPSVRVPAAMKTPALMSMFDHNIFCRKHFTGLMERPYAFDKKSVMANCFQAGFEIGARPRPVGATSPHNVKEF